MPHATPLKFLAPGWFSLVMGLSGLALAWRAAEPLLGPMALGVSLVSGGLALLVFLLLLGASWLRVQRYPAALAEDLRHPVRHGFVATLPVSVLLLATWLHALMIDGWWVQVMWWMGSLGQWWVTLWVLGRWLAPAPANTASNAGPAGMWPALTPVLFIAVVGNVVAALAGQELGDPAWAAAQWGVGLLFWPVLLALLLARRAAHGPLPDRLLPTWFITVAPPAIIGACLLSWQAPLWLAQAFWGMALLSLLWAGQELPRMLKAGFGLPFWAMSFPLASLTSLTLKIWTAEPSALLQTLGLLLLAVCTLVIAGLSIATWKGLRNGSLLAPEPVAHLTPVSPS